MALIGPGSRCAVCREPIDTRQPLFATSGVFLPRWHPLVEHCDAPFHWDCYAAWPHRVEFARAYFDALVAFAQGSPYWGLAYLSERVAVSVNPAPSVAEIQVAVAETGTILRMPLTAWQEWVDGLPATCSYALVGPVIEAEMADLKRDLPDAESVVNRVDWEAKHRLRAQEQERRRQQAVARRKALSMHQAKWADSVRRGPACPHCQASEGTRPVDVSPERKSYFICGNCGRSFDPP